MKAKSALQSLRQGIVICDAKGCVVHVNAAYAEFTGIRPEKIRGKRIRDVRVGSLVPKVLRTGEAIEGVYKSDGERSYFASVYPIYEAGEKKGTVSIVTTLEQSRARKRPGGGTLKERVREFERQEIRRTLLLYDDNLEGKKQAAEAWAFRCPRCTARWRANKRAEKANAAGLKEGMLHGQRTEDGIFTLCRGRVRSSNRLIFRFRFALPYGVPMFRLDDRAEI